MTVHCQPSTVNRQPSTSCMSVTGNDVKRDRTYFLSKSHSSGLPILPVNV
ncbi:hypothetical protein QUA16_20885 [Microcoleus sp. S13_C3]